MNFVIFLSADFQKLMLEFFLVFGGLDLFCLQMYSFLHPVSLLTVFLFLSTLFLFPCCCTSLWLWILNMLVVIVKAETQYIWQRGVDCRALKLDGAALIFLRCIYFCPPRPHFSNNVMFLQTQQAFRASNETCRSYCFCLKFHFCLNVDRIKLCGSSEWDKVLHMWPRKPKQWAERC